MSTSWLRWTFAAAMIAVALVHVTRVAAPRARRPHRARIDGELTHAAMGVAMTVMLLDGFGPSTGRRLAVLFAVPLVWFLWRGMHGYVMDGPRAVGAQARQVIGCAAMVYMLVAVSGTSLAASSMPGMSMAPASFSTPIATATLLVATLALAVWAMVRPVAVGLTGPPVLAAGCQLAMSAATVYMLIAI